MSRARQWAVIGLSVLYALTWLVGIARNDYSGLQQVTPALVAIIGILVGYRGNGRRDGAENGAQP